MQCWPIHGRLQKFSNGDGANPKKAPPPPNEKSSRKALIKTKKCKKTVQQGFFLLSSRGERLHKPPLQAPMIYIV